MEYWSNGKIPPLSQPLEERDPALFLTPTLHYSFASLAPEMLVNQILYGEHQSQALRARNLQFSPEFKALPVNADPRILLDQVPAPLGKGHKNKGRIFYHKIYPGQTVKDIFFVDGGKCQDDLQCLACLRAWQGNWRKLQAGDPVYGLKPCPGDCETP